MEISDYYPIVNYFADGFPSATLNREISLYPSADYILYYLDEALSDIVPASVELSAMWDNTEKTAVNFYTRTKFVYDDNNDQFALTFALVEDGMKGTGSGWSQTNYMSGSSGEDDMTFWYSVNSPVSGLEFNHVAVAAWNIQNGVNNSVNPTIIAGEHQQYTFKGDISSKSVIQDKSKLKAVALLIDRSSGKIVNAAQTDIKDFSTDIISLSSDNNDIVGYYSIDGRQLPTPQRGLNIIKYSDGKVKKVIIK